ncbi:E1 ubiquitin-activating protein uba2 [Tulasnella sp. 418]|nr:E1 ubiquitin-activating protein uba2 [Tulasnella sp. 418]
MPRNSHALAVLGPTLYAKLPQTRVLVVGAGGIGCELLKNIVLTGFGDITLLDLDTIDLSNLNRQFLFRKKDVKQSKALVAARTASAFNPSCKITPIHGNIKEEQYDVPWFKSFDIVLNALDNLDARRHVNKMCMAADVPLIESGTAGYLGQVQPLIKDKTECFDCMPKTPPKSFPVCTIRSTPSTPIHCIVWAKSYLLPQLFGEQEDESELDKAATAGENATEIANLRKEAQAFKMVREAILSSDEEGMKQLVFDKVFKDDINRLLSMKDMWRARKPPTPLDRKQILAGTFVLPSRTQPNGTSGGSERRNGNSHKNGPSNSNVDSSSSSNPKLKDQQELSLTDMVLLFDDSLCRLSDRLKSGKETEISFDKDDIDTLDFVTATANLRAVCYGIDRKTKWEVKEMAGNIIPAIATTNAVIAGLIVLQALHVLRVKGPSNSWTGQPQIRFCCLQAGKPSAPLGTFGISPPNPTCGICRDVYVSVQCDPGRVTLGELVTAVLDAEKDQDDTESSRREVSVYEGTRMLSDPDWDDNFERSLESLGCGRGKFVTMVDDDGDYENVVLCLSPLPENAPLQSPAFVLPSSFPGPKPKHKVPKASSPDITMTTRKRSVHPEDDEPPAKRTKMENGEAKPNGVQTTSESTFREEDGVIVIDFDSDDDIEIL